MGESATIDYGCRSTEHQRQEQMLIRLWCRLRDEMHGEIRADVTIGRVLQAAELLGIKLD